MRRVALELNEHGHEAEVCIGGEGRVHGEGASEGRLAHAASAAIRRAGQIQGVGRGSGLREETDTTHDKKRTQKASEKKETVEAEGWAGCCCFRVCVLT